MKCELLVLENGDQVVAGVITLSNGKLSAKPTTSHDAILCKNVLHQSSGQDPKQWLQSLPKKYSGTYLRARLV